MSPIDEKRLEELRKRVERFQFGKTIQIAADMKFLLEKIDELQREKGKSA